MSIAYTAMMIAREAHKDQVRKYTGNPYTDHLAEVAGIVATATHFDGVSSAECLIATAWLHDVVEDCGYEERMLHEAIDPSMEAYPWSDVDQIIRGVMWLSDLEEGNRATRKRLSRERLAAAPGWVQTIKCADLISNTSSIVKHDPDFAKVYLEEKRLLLDVMTKADRRLWNIASSMARQ